MAGGKDIKITLTPDERRALLAAVHGAMDDMDTDDEVAPLASIVAKIEKARK